jgi:hypothetical protein
VLERRISGGKNDGLNDIDRTGVSYRTEGFWPQCAGLGKGTTAWGDKFGEHEILDFGIFGLEFSVTCQMPSRCAR